MNKTLLATSIAALFAATALVACGDDDTPAAAAPVATAPAPAASAPAAATEIKVRVFGFNDFHGQLEAAGTFGNNLSVPVADRPPVGGADFLAAHIAELKKQNPNNVVVGAGDFIGATPLISSLFNDEPAIETLNRIGLEFNAVGNHEFDKGSAELLRLQNGGCRVVNGAQDPNSCRGASVGTPVPYEGAKFKWLSANVVSTATGRTLLPAYGIKEFNGVKVAFIGMTLRATPTIVTPTGVAGLEFRDEAATVNALIPELRAQGIESVVVLVHQGGIQTGTLGDINGCEGNLAGSDIAAIVRQLDNAVDLVVSGHSHQVYNCRLPNVTGRTIPVTSASAQGRVLSDIELTINTATKDVTASTATNRLVVRNNPAIPANPVVAKIIADYSALIAPIANVVIGSISAAVPNGRLTNTGSPDGACNNPAGNLIADAQLAATSPANFGGAVAAFINGGGVRDAGFTFPSSAANEGDGNITYREAFTVQPFGNNLVTISLTTADVKNFLEEQFAGCLGQGASTTRFALPSGGFKYAWDGAKACGERISNVTIRTGTTTETLVDAAGVVQNPTKTYRITVNNFMADGGDGYSTLVKGTNRLGGGQDIDALVAYMNANFKAPKPAYTPGTNPADAGTPRISRLNSTSTVCPNGAVTNP